MSDNSARPRPPVGHNKPPSDDPADYRKPARVPMWVSEDTTAIDKVRGKRTQVEQGTRVLGGRLSPRGWRLCQLCDSDGKPVMPMTLLAIKNSVLSREPVAPDEDDIVLEEGDAVEGEGL